MLLSSLVAGLVCGPRIARAADVSGWTLSWENDSFTPPSLSSDESYTNGVRFALQRDWQWTNQVGTWWGRHYPLASHDTRHDITTSLLVGQNFFTPTIITTYEADSTDRPYAGLLYSGVRIEITEPEPEKASAFQFRAQHALEFDLGVIGPPALADQVQTGVHLLRTSRVPKGWDEQLKTELAASVQAMSRVKIGKHYADLVPHAGLMLGNPQTYAFGGATARLGWNMTGFPALIVRNTASPLAERPRWEAGGLVGAEGRSFAPNAFVDGNALGGPPALDSRPLIGDVYGGFTFRLTDWRFSYTLVRRSSEVQTAGPADREHNYGSVTFAFEPGKETPEHREGKFIGKLVDGFFAPIFRHTLFEAGIGGGASRAYGAPVPDVSQEGIGMRVAFHKRVTGDSLARSLSLGVEMIGLVREGPVPPTASDRHLDAFMINRVITLRWLPFGPRLGPGEFHVRAGAGQGSAKVQSTLAKDHFYTRDDKGTGILAGGGYAFPLGAHGSVGLDTAWNQLDVQSAGGPSVRFLATTLTVQWRP
jgi:hypothetical protein